MPRVKAPPSALAAASALGDRRAVPHVEWVAALAGVSPREVVEVLREVGGLVAVEREVRERHRAAGRSYYAQFRAPLELYALTRLLRPKHIVETGVSSGVSSLHFLLGLRENGDGTLHSIDLPVHQRGARLGARESIVSIPPGRSSGWAIPEGLTRGWDLRIGESQRLLPGLVAETSEVGIFLHDSLHTPTHLTFELTTVAPKLGERSVLLADNTKWTGRAFPAFAERVGARVVRRGRGDLDGLRWPGGPASVARPTRGRPADRSRTTR